MYGKFFASTFSGSMMAAGPEVFAVWAYVIANAHDACVELNPRLLAAVIGSTPERMQAAIDALCEADLASRSKDAEGRRLVRQGQFQYHVTNHAAYKAIRNEDERRTYNREAKKRERARKSVNVKDDVNDSQCQSAVSAQAEAEVEEEEVSQKTTPAAPTIRPPTPKKAAFDRSMVADVSPAVVDDWLTQRRASKAPVTKTVIDGFRREAAKAGITLEAAFSLACVRGWRGFEAAWVKDADKAKASIFDGAL